MKKSKYLPGLIVFLIVFFGNILFAQNSIPAAIKTKADYYNYLAEQRGKDKLLEKPSSSLDRKRSILNVGNVEARIRNSATFGYDRDGKCYVFPAGGNISYRWTMCPARTRR